MTRDEIVDMVAEVDFQFLGKQNWNAFDKYEAFAKLVAEKEREKSEHLLWLFQEWKEDHLSQYNYIEAVEAIRARGD